MILTIVLSYYNIGDDASYSSLIVFLLHYLLILIFLNERYFRYYVTDDVQNVDAFSALFICSNISFCASSFIMKNDEDDERKK